jgi:hypothetical protein
LPLSCLINRRNQDNKVALVIFIIITYYLPVLIGVFKVLVSPYILYGFFLPVLLVVFNKCRAVTVVINAGYFAMQVFKKTVPYLG